jgi:hypothetical protein
MSAPLGFPDEHEHREHVVTVRLTTTELARLDAIAALYGDAPRSWVLRQGLVVVSALVDAGEPVRGEE